MSTGLVADMRQLPSDRIRTNRLVRSGWKNRRHHRAPPQAITTPQVRVKARWIWTCLLERVRKRVLIFIPTSMVLAVAVFRELLQPGFSMPC